MKRRRYKYLYQLILTSCVLVIVPTLLFSVVWKRSYGEMKRLNNEHYREISRLFSGTFAESVTRLKKHATVFSVNSKDNKAGMGIFYEGTRKMQESQYYYLEACKSLADYCRKIAVDDLAVYYYGKDLVLNEESKYNVENYIQWNLNSKEGDGQYEKLSELFEEESYDRSKVIYKPIRDTNGAFKKLLIGVCTELGKDREKALLLFSMSQKDFEFFYLSAQGQSWEKYYAFDSATGENLFAIGEKAETGAVTSVDQINTDKENVFMVQNERMDLTFILDVSDDQTQNNILTFYSRMKLMMLYIVILMLLICCLAVYYNYRPVYSLLERTKRTGKDEFDLFSSVMDEQDHLVTEQRMQIIDLLMNCLIYGMPISEKHIDKLGVSERIRRYCVFLIDNYVLNSDEVEQVMEKVEQEFHTLLFITDLQGEKATVLISFMENEGEGIIHEWLKNWCALHIQKEYVLHRGCAVEDINEIRKSLDFCRAAGVQKSDSRDIDEKEKVMENVREKAKAAERLKQEVLSYLEIHFKDADLSQTKVADDFRISVYTLSRLFKNQFGIGFTEYVNGKRLEYAKELLLTTDLSIKEISTMAGIMDANYLARIFRRYTGVSPVEFRNKQGV